jgi:tetratricopeptide (TPR) repeat protein
MTSERPPWAVRLRAHRERRGWSIARTAQQYRALDPTQPADLQTLADYLRKRWEAGKVVPSEHNRAQLCRLYDDADLFAEVTQRAPVAPYRAIRGMPAFDTRNVDDTDISQADEQVQAVFAAIRRCVSPAQVTSGSNAQASSGHPHTWERTLIMAAAHEASEHASWAETTNVGEATLEQLDADVVRLANDYVRLPPLPMFDEMLRVRQRVYRLLEGHQKPADTAHLYLIVGTLSGLLANASTDLGHFDAAAEQARAAWAYGEVAGHNGLRAWTRGMQALIEYWCDRPRQAIHLVQAAQRYADSATAKTRLFAIEARVWSRLGDQDEANRCMRAAEEARESNDMELVHDEIGGVFGFNNAKYECYSGATHIHLGQADTALGATSRAIELYASGPEKERSYGAESLARVDSAVAYLLKGSLDGAADALQPVLTLPIGKRIAQLAERLTGVRLKIAVPAFGNSQQARELGERVEEFCAVTAASKLPPTSQAN